MAVVYGNQFTPIWKTFGGTAHASYGTNVSTSTLFANKNTYNSIIAPFEVSKQMASAIDESQYAYWGNKENTVWYKRIRAFKDNAPYTSENRIHADVILTFTGGATFEKVMASVNGGYTDLGGDVRMEIYLGVDKVYYDYGYTRYAYSSGPTSIGFANNTDSAVPSGQPVMGNGISLFSSAGWEARHVISYTHTSAGRDVTRCQFLCWGDITGVVEETTWYARDYR